MLPLCSATNYWSCHTKVSVCGGFKSLSPYCMTFDVNCNNVDRVVLNFLNSTHLDAASFKRGQSSCLYFNYVGNRKQFVSMGMNAQSMYQGGLPKSRQCALSSHQVGVVDEPRYFGSNDIMFVENSYNSATDDPLVDLLSNTIDNTEVLPRSADVNSVAFDTVQTFSNPDAGSLNMGANSLSFLETKFSDVVSKLSESAADTFNKGEIILNNLSDSVTLSLTTLAKTNQAVDNSINEMISFIKKSGGSVDSKLAGRSSELKEALGRAGHFALDVLRGTIIVVEDSLVQGGRIAGYAYSSVKEFLPPEFQEALSLSEESVEKVLTPAGTAFQQVYMAVEGFEESLGLDPKDPLVPFVLFLALSGTL